MVENIDQCYGCRACEHICPRSAITMNPNNDGFLYPLVNLELCIECDACEQVCPIHTKFEQRNQQHYYCFVNNDAKVLENSSSGGAFYSLCYTFCDGEEPYNIFGAKWGRELRVQHGTISDLLELNVFQKSKYLQSDTRDSYIEVKNHLLKGVRVVYSGTPCQVAGLKSFLGKAYDNLLTIDIICHGVPSQKVFDRYRQALEKKYGASVVSVTFRKKLRLFGIIDPYGVEVCFEDSRVEQFYSFEDAYLRAFLAALDYRMSCKTCQFAQENRVSDITIGDFWGINHLKKHAIDSRNGVSLILTNSENGQRLVSCLKGYIQEVQKQDAVPYNHNLREPTKFNPNRKDFFERLQAEEFEQIVDSYVNKKSRLKYYLSARISNDLKVTLKKIIRWCNR